jgi:hypothetical protein
MKSHLKSITKLVGLVILALPLIALAQNSANWNNSPNNWNNSSSNWNNSSSNWNNSPSNWNNSSSNWSATNGVYDNSGNRLGYAVPSPTGVVNYFDNNGNRIGYEPQR